MGSNSEMFQRHLHLVRKDNEPAPIPVRTRYAIRGLNGMWLGENYHWVEEPKDALKFEFMTFAMAHGTLVMGFTVDFFTVEAV